MAVIHAAARKRGAHWVSRVGRRLSLRELHVLLAVAEAGSMAKAAAHLSISQPAVSKAIAELEATVGVPLIARGGRGLALTECGELLRQRARTVFAELRDGLEDLSMLADPSAGTVRVACPESMAAGLLPSAIERFLVLRPNASVRVDQAQTVTLEFRELRERNVDLMVGRISRDFAEADLEAKVLFEEQLYVVAGAQSRWARRRSVTLAELAGERWILTPADNVVGALIDSAFRARGLPVPRPTIESFSFHLRRHLLAHDEFLTVIPGSMLNFFNQRGREFKALPVDVEFRAQPVAVIGLKTRVQPAAVSAFIDCLEAAAAALVPAKVAARATER